MHYKIAIADSGHNKPSKDTLQKAYEIGREIARQGSTLVTGATAGVSEWAARGAKSASGISIGLSPASSKQAHVRTYKLPTKNMDMVIYTGFDYTGRSLLMSQSSDAVIVCGGNGMLNESATILEEYKIVGLLIDIKDLKVVATQKGIIVDSHPKQLVDKVIKAIKGSQKRKKASK